MWNDKEEKQVIMHMEEASSAFGSYYVTICEIMKKNNVPKDRMPSFQHFLSKAFACIDEDKMQTWIMKYIDNEKVDIVE